LRDVLMEKLMAELKGYRRVKLMVEEKEKWRGY
jgi:hypothetical protein